MPSTRHGGVENPIQQAKNCSVLLHTHQELGSRGQHNSANRSEPRRYSRCVCQISVQTHLPDRNINQTNTGSPMEPPKNENIMAKVQTT